MSDRDALMRAILENPACDTARGVYADWLEENGEPEKAEFIRLQCGQGVAEDVQMQLWDMLHKSENWFANFRKPFGIPWDCWGVKSDGSVAFEPKIGPNEFTVSRGFVSSVRCRLADWVGGDPCPDCDHGVQWRSMPPDSRVCESCGGDPERRKPGTGRTPAHGPRIVAEQPVVEVTTGLVSDRIDTVDRCWIAARPGLIGDGQIPPEIFDLLEGGRLESGGDEWADRFGFVDRWRIYPADSIDAAISLALVNWARREAGLPPLEDRR